MRRKARNHRHRGDRGQIAGIEALPFGLLVCTVGTLFIVNLWGVVDTKFAADAAARSATRYVVETARTDIDADVLRAGAQELAEQTLADHGRPQSVATTVEAHGDGLLRCQRVSVVVRTSIPVIRLPFIGDYGDAFEVVARHSELVDPTRSGVGGDADCIR